MVPTDARGYPRSLAVRVILIEFATIHIFYCHSITLVSLTYFFTFCKWFFQIFFKKAFETASRGQNLFILPHFLLYYLTSPLLHIFITNRTTKPHFSIAKILIKKCLKKRRKCYRFVTFDLCKTTNFCRIFM